MRKCPDCGDTGFLTRRSLRTHRRDTHGFVKCSCNRTFLKDEYMAQHLRMSRKHGALQTLPPLLPANPFPCGSCNRSFKSTFSLSQHERSKHGQNVPVKRAVGSTTTSMPTAIPIPSDRSFKHNFSEKQYQEGQDQFLAVLRQHAVTDITTKVRTLNISQSTTREASSPASAASGNDLYGLSSTNINTFISNEVQPDDSYIRSCNAVVDRLVSFLQNNTPDKIRPSKIIKGGSLGKGTAVKGKSDIDLAMIMARYRNIKSLLEDMENILSELEKYLGSYGQIRVTGRTEHAVQLEVSCHKGHTHSVDVLPAVSVLPDQLSAPTHSFKAILRPMFEEMGTKDWRTRSFLSASLGPLQVELTRPLPTKLKSLIRLVKYWKKEKLAVIEGPKWPTSYVLELVTLNAWMNAGKPENFDIVRALHAVLTSLENHNQFRVVFDDSIAFYDRDLLRIEQEPYIMDPCNPYNDVYHGYFGKAWAWKDVAEKAREWKSKDLFSGVANTRTNW